MHKPDISHGAHPQPSVMSQCIDSWEREDVSTNVTRRYEDDQLCIGSLCWKNEALEVIKTIVTAYNDPSTSIK